MAILSEQISRQDMLKAIGAIRLRAETENDALSTLDNFVALIDFDTLSTPNTQIIYGRNGTGKTHLLKAYREHCREEYEETKILPVYIDFKKLDLFQVSSETTIQDLIVRFYQRFLYEVIKQLQKFSEEAVTPNFLERLFHGEAADRKASIDDSIKDLISRLSLQQFEDQVQERLIKVAQEQSRSRGDTVEVGAEAALSASGVPTAKIRAGVGLKAEDLQVDTQTVELVFEGFAVLEYDAIRKQLENIIEQCGAKGIVLLVDEWSSIELNVQPLLAEMIKKTLTISQSISLKIVALPFYTRTSAALENGRQRLGLQSAIDISLLVDLDELLNFSLHPQLVKDFLTTVAYKHVGKDIPRLREEHTVKEYEDYVCNEIFEGEQAYFEVVKASEGNPRDYLNILSYCCNVASQSADRRVSKVETIVSAAAYFRSIKAKTLDQDTETLELYDQIFVNVVQNKNKLFLVTPEKARSDARLQELWHYRFIHLVNSDFTAVGENMTPRIYSIYSMDYGKMLSLRMDEHGQKLADSITAASEKVVDRYNMRGLGFAWGFFTQVVLGPQIQGQLREIERHIDSGVDVEEADITDVDYLVRNCVIDDLLEDKQD